MEIDALGVFNMSRACLPALKQAGDSVIINISATLHYGADRIPRVQRNINGGSMAPDVGYAVTWTPSSSCRSPCSSGESVYLFIRHIVPKEEYNERSLMQDNTYECATDGMALSVPLRFCICKCFYALAVNAHELMRTVRMCYSFVCPSPNNRAGRYDGVD
eukprot:scaffold234423_cov25-Prasinocladus_malaysianus.AAC.1